MRWKIWISATIFIVIILRNNSNIANYEHKKPTILLHFKLISKWNSDEAREPVISTTPEFHQGYLVALTETRGELVLWAGSNEDVPKGEGDNTVRSRSL